MTYTRNVVLVLACALLVTCDYVPTPTFRNARIRTYQRIPIGNTEILVPVTVTGNNRHFRTINVLSPRQEVSVDVNPTNVASEVPVGQPEEQYGLPTEQPVTTSTTTSSGPYPPEAPYPPEVPASTYGEPARRTFNFRANTWGR